MADINTNMSPAGNMTPVPTGNQPAPIMSTLTGYNQTGSLPNTTPTGSAAPVAVITSTPAKQATQQQQSTISDLTNTIAQNKAANLANPTVSIVDALNAKGQPSDFASRSALATSLGMTNYSGTSAQNAQLIQAINQPPKTTTPSNATGAISTQGVSTPTSGTSSTQVNPTGNNQNGAASTGSTLNPDNSLTTNYSDGTSTTFQQNPDGTYAIKNTTVVPTTGGTTTGGTPAVNTNISSALNDMHNAYDSYNQTIQQIFNGTFLTPDQRSQIAAVQSTFDQVRTMQQQANANYEQSVAQAGFRGGQNVTDPNQFLAKNQATISTDLQKIVTIDNAAAKALNDLKMSFMDKNYKVANDAYTTLNSYLKEKNDLIQKSVDTANALAKDTRDYNLNLEKQQETEKQNTIQNQQKATELAISSEKTQSEITSNLAKTAESWANVAKTKAETAQLNQFNAPAGGVAVQTTGNGNPSTVDQQTYMDNLNKTNPMLAATIKGIANYTLDPTKVASLKGNAREALIAQVKLYDPTFDEANYAARASYLKNIQSGTYSQAIVAANKSVNHLDSLLTAMQSLNNGKISATGNAIGNTLGQPFSQNLQKNLAVVNTEATGVSGELAKFFKGTGASDVQSIADWKEQVSPNATPAQQEGLKQGAVALLSGQLDTLYQQYKSNIGKDAGTNILQPETIAKLHSLGADVSTYVRGTPYESIYGALDNGTPEQKNIVTQMIQDGQSPEAINYTLGTH